MTRRRRTGPRLPWALAAALAVAAGCAKADLAARRPARAEECSPVHAAVAATPAPAPLPPAVPAQASTAGSAKASMTSSAKASTASELARGSELFRSYGCALCHGPGGRGDGRLAATLRTRPRDLRDLAAYTQGTSVAAIASTIEHGIARSGMPAHPFVPPPERELLARYVLSLPAPSPPSRGGAG